MKKLIYIILLLLSLSSQPLLAQTQKGYVKTLGRPEKKGEALAGVSIRVKGEHNPVLSDNDGTFSLLLPGLKNGDAYTLQQVQKSGYELNETNLIGQPNAFSDKVPLTIVMVSSLQLQADKQRIENNAFKVAEKNYTAKLQQLENQINSNSISIEQYQEEQKKLLSKFENYQSLIDGLAEHFAHTDYDGLDEKDKEINLCIENGDLERADSLINLLFDPLDVLKRNKDALAKIDRQIAQAKGMLKKANEDMAAIQKQQQKDAEYLYQLYTIALAKLDDEKAQYYIETRAELDTTNGRWQIDAATFFSSHLLYQKSIVYFSRAVNIFRSENREYDLSYALYGLGSQLQAADHNHKEKNPAAENALNEAVEIQRRLAETYPYVEQSLAVMMINLGEQYLATERYEESKRILEEAVEILRRVDEDNPSDQFIYRLSHALNILGELNLTLKQYKKSEDYFTDAYKYSIKVSNNNPDYEYAVAEVLTKMAALYDETKRSEKCKEVSKNAINIYRRLAETKPRFYEPYLASALVTLGTRMVNSIDFNKIDNKTNKNNKEMALLVEAIGYIDEGTKIYKQNISLGPMYEEQYEMALITLAYLYMAFDTDKAYITLEDLLPLMKKHYQDIDYVNPLFSDRYEQIEFYLLALKYQSIIGLYKNHPEKSEQYAKEILSVNPFIKEIIPTLAASLLIQGKYEEAEKLCRNNKGTLKNDFNQLLNGLNKANLIPKEHQDEVKRIKKILKE